MIINKAARPEAEGPCQLRMTRQRRVILGQLGARRWHPTAGELYRRVRRELPRISVATVYRNLDVLWRAGLLRKLRLGSGQWRYDGTLLPHYHVRCVRCGVVSDLPAGAFGNLDAVARSVSEFKVSGHQLDFEGLCRACGSTAREGPR